MLDTHTPFPQAGSYCLWGADPEAARQEPQLARIKSRMGDVTQISLPLVEGSRGMRRVDHAELQDGTNLTAAEAREKDTLNAKESAFARGRGRPLTKKERQRLDHLREAAGRATVLKGLLEQLEIRQRAMSRAA